MFIKYEQLLLNFKACVFSSQSMPENSLANYNEYQMFLVKEARNGNKVLRVIRYSC